VLEYPVGAGEGVLKTLGCAVAGGRDGREVEVDFGYYASHIDALVIAHAATRETVGDLKGGEMSGGDLVLADCAFETLS